MYEPKARSNACTQDKLASFIEADNVSCQAERSLGLRSAFLQVHATTKAAALPNSRGPIALIKKAELLACQHCQHRGGRALPCVSVCFKTVSSCHKLQLVNTASWVGCKHVSGGMLQHAM